MALFGWGKSARSAKNGGSLSLAQARLERGEVLLGDLHNLKTRIGEARYENDFTQVKASFLRQEYEVAAAHLEEIKDTYTAAQTRTLARDPKAKGIPRKEARVLVERQTAIREILKCFNEVIRGLHRKVEKESKRQVGTRQPKRSASATGLPEEFVRQFTEARDAASKAELVNRFFSALSVNTTGDVKPSTLYARRGRGELALLMTADRFPTSTVIPISDALTGRSLKPLALQDFLRLGKDRTLIQLQSRQREGSPKKDGASPASEEPGLRFTSLDLTDFNQLVLAADQSGLMSSVALSNARDQHFRQQHYQHAFGTVERAYQEFQTKAAQRMAQLRQEEQAYKRGRLKMSPRQWQEKQRQDSAQTQRVERARKHFKLVLDGLRILHLQQQREGEAGGRRL